MPHLGSCQCGAVTFRVTTQEPLIVYACHCLDCQTWSSSAFTEHALLREGDINIWTKRKQPWLAIPGGVPSWPESPTPEQFFEAVAPPRANV